MTKREAAIVSAYTGILLGDWADTQFYIEELMSRPVFTHEIASLLDEIKGKAKNDFMNIKIED